MKTMIAAILLCGMLAACGDEGTSGDTSSGPTASQQASAQNADAAGSGMEKGTDLASDAVVDSGAPGTAANKAAPSKMMVSTTTINYQADVVVTVDLDALDADGHDPHPNASGRFTVSAHGSVTGSEASGQATYAASVTWDTEAVFTDPACGATATLAQGAGWSYTLVIEWTKTDEQHWLIEARSDLSGTAHWTVVRDGRTVTVNGTVVRHATATFSRSGNTYAASATWTGSKTVIVSDGVETHTVIITMESIDRIFIEVDDVRFGPLTWFQVLVLWGFDCRS